MALMGALGSWEAKGRSPVLAAILGTTLIAALYSLAGNLAFLAYMLVDLGRMGAVDWYELSSGVIARYRAPLLLLTMIFEFLFFGGGTYLLFRRWHGLPLRPSFRIGLPSPLSLPLALAGAIGLFPLALLAGEAFERAFPFLRELAGRSEGLLSASDAGSWTLLAAAVCLTPAICEEFLFRGYLQGTLSRRMRSPWSWLLTGTCFALVHQNYLGLGALLVIGIYLAFVFDSSGSIWPGALVHLCYNGAVIVLSNLRSAPAWAFDAEGFVRLPLVLASLPFAALAIAALAAGKRRRLGKVAGIPS
jgi:uncharacterized protein